MTIAVDLRRKATKQTNKQTNKQNLSSLTKKLKVVVGLICNTIEPLLFKPGVYFYIKYIGKLLGLTNEAQRSMVLETCEFEQPKFVCTL